MKKNIEEIKNCITKVIDKKRLDNMTEDANSLKKNLDFFLKGFETGVDNSWDWVYAFNEEMIHDEYNIPVEYQSKDKKGLRFNELLAEGDIDVPSEWELFFEEEEKNKEYQDYLAMKDKFEKPASGSTPAPIPELNPTKPVKEKEDSFIIKMWTKIQKKY